MTLLPEYRNQLYTAAERRARARRGNRSLVRVLPVAVSTAVVLGVAIVAVTTLSHRHGPNPPGPSGTTASTTTALATTPSATTPSLELLSPASAGPLVDMLGVLRRPQTEADRQTWVPGFFMTFASPGCRAASTPLQCTLRLDQPLIREVDVPGSGYRVGLLPYTGAGSTVGVAVTLRGPGINYDAAGPWSDSTTFPPGLSELRNQGLMLTAYVSDGVDRGVIVVPDGVARVTIGPVRLLDRSISARVAPTPGTGAAVHDNVALFQLNGLTVQNLGLRSSALRAFYSQGAGGECRLTLAIYRLPVEAHMNWLAPDGRVISHALIRFPVYVGTHHPAPGTIDLPPGCPH